jgi:hypothetical protein
MPAALMMRWPKKKANPVVGAARAQRRRIWQPPDEYAENSCGCNWALGATQIIGYGTLYYSYSILALAVATELRWSPEWVFGILRRAAGGRVFAPIAGIWADRFGAGRLMLFGSPAAAAALFAPCAWALALLLGLWRWS